MRTQYLYEAGFSTLLQIKTKQISQQKHTLKKCLFTKFLFTATMKETLETNPITAYTFNRFLFGLFGEKNRLPIVKMKIL